MNLRILPHPGRRGYSADEMVDAPAMIAGLALVDDLLAFLDAEDEVEIEIEAARLAACADKWF